MINKIRDWLFITAKENGHSYKDFLIEFLTDNKPKRMLEWGTGRSTIIMKELCPDAEIHSIENSLIWFIRWKLGISRVNLYHISLNDGYTTPDFPDKYFDFIFIDSEKNSRNECMKSALRLLKDDGALMLHDSTWIEFQEGKRLFRVVEEREQDKTALLRK